VSGGETKTVADSDACPKIRRVLVQTEDTTSKRVAREENAATESKAAPRPRRTRGKVIRCSQGASAKQRRPTPRKEEVHLKKAKGGKG